MPHFQKIESFFVFVLKWPQKCSFFSFVGILWSFSNSVCALIRRSGIILIDANRRGFTCEDRRMKAGAPHRRLASRGLSAGG
jgi:hypothetical protein